MTRNETLLNGHERVKHGKHQLEGVELLTRTSADPTRTAEHAGVVYARDIWGVFALGDQVGAGKSKQVVDSAQILFLDKTIDTVLVFVPGYARSAWAESDPSLGEVARHAWLTVPNVIHEFHGKHTEIDFTAPALHWVVTNYEFIRRDERRDDLLAQLKGRRVWVVADEAWMIKGTSAQTRAATMIRRKRGELATILNGTLLADGKALDLYHQYAFLDPSIIGTLTKSHFKAKFCVMGGWGGKNIIGYQNLEELHARIAPYTRCVKTRDCFDLPPMLDPVIIEARMTPETWKLYSSQRDDMVTWFEGQASVSRQAIVKLLRLTQITSGYLGGLEDVDEDSIAAPMVVAGVPADLPAWMKGRLGIDEPETTANGQGASQGPAADASAVEGQPGRGPADAARRFTKEVGREKLDALLEWLEHHAPDRTIVWCKFRAELDRCAAALRARGIRVEELRGGQKDEDRARAKRLVGPGSTLKGIVVGNPAAGGAALTFSGASLMVFLSYGPRLLERTQSIGRIERPGAVEPMLVADVVAVGPKGQKTIDHRVLKTLRDKDDMATWTYDRLRALMADLKKDGD